MTKPRSSHWSLQQGTAQDEQANMQPKSEQNSVLASQVNSFIMQQQQQQQQQTYGDDNMSNNANIVFANNHLSAGPRAHVCPEALRKIYNPLTRVRLATRACPAGTSCKLVAVAEEVRQSRQARAKTCERAVKSRPELVLRGRPANEEV